MNHTQLMPYNMLWLGAFAKLWRATISFVMPVRPSVHKNLGSHRADYHEIWYLCIHRKFIKCTLPYNL